MPSTVISTLEIKNGSNQSVTIWVTPSLNSPVFNPAGGHTVIPGNSSIVVEESRIDKEQLNQLARNVGLKLTQLNRKIDF